MKNGPSNDFPNVYSAWQLRGLPVYLILRVYVCVCVCVCAHVSKNKRVQHRINEGFPLMFRFFVLMSYARGEELHNKKEL